MKRAIKWWLAGLGVFAVVLLMHAPLAIDQVPGGILDHQAAGSGARADAIQSAWEMAGLTGIALTAMIADIVFILIYGSGSIALGKAARAVPGRAFALLGRFLWICGWVFLLTDLVETSAQIVQLVMGEGSDPLARLAASVRPAKIVSWIGTFLVGLLLVGLWWRKRKLER